MRYSIHVAIVHAARSLYSERIEIEADSQKEAEAIALDHFDGCNFAKATHTIDPVTGAAILLPTPNK